LFGEWFLELFYFSHGKKKITFSKTKVTKGGVGVLFPGFFFPSHPPLFTLVYAASKSQNSFVLLTHFTKEDSFVLVSKIRPISNKTNYKCRKYIFKKN
jgi:hypothetical protein